MSLLIGATSPLQGASGQGAAGFEIEQSLRFSGNSTVLTNTSIDTGTKFRTFTFSCWMKQANSKQNGVNPFRDGTGSNAIGNFQINYAGTSVGDGAFTFNLANGGNGFVPSMRFRDLSAWYHIVLRYNGPSAACQLWVNGEAITAGTGTLTTGSGGIQLDGFSFGNNNWQGYLAEAILAESQLSATDFGEYNTDGVWVPKKYSGTYGNDGFHLTFARSQSPNGVGTDSSGNGHHFTASGFDTADVALYSAHVSTPAGGFPANNGPAALFDSSTTTFCQPNNTGTYTFTPLTPIQYTSLEVWSAGAKFSLNGGAEQQPATGSFQSIDSSSGTLTTLAFISPTGAAGAAVRAIRINGTTILVDNTDSDVDINDTPTSNYPTWNPLIKNDGSYAKANLRYVAPTADSSTGSTFVFNTSNSISWYVELTHSLANRSAFGVCNQDERFFDTFDPRSCAAPNIVYDSNGPIWINGTEQSPSQAAWNAGSTISMRFDSSTRNLIFANNGTDQTGVTTTLPADKDVTIICGDMTGAAGGSTFDINFGQFPFLQAVPNGFVAPQTNNLTEPTIKDGRDHFDIITYSGNDASPRTLTGLEFQPDIVWTKRRNSTASHLLYDSLRGFGVDKHLHTDANVVEGSLAELNTDVGGFVSNNASSGFVTTAGSTNSLAINQSGNTYVAWCWKCDESFTPTVTGVSNASGKRNKTAGCSILTYTGNNSSGTITHGLDSAPEVILFKRRSVADNWVVYHAARGATKALTLDLADAEFNSTFLSNTAPTGPTGSPASTITLGGVSGANGTGTFVAYCWHSVKGYSKFGSYTGNGDGSSPNSDGPYINLGFRPALVIIKRTDSSVGGEWSMYDSSRGPVNPNRAVLLADSNASEPASQDGLDFLSNGFKVKGGNGTFVNITGGTYVYMAFAENPFGGENTPPATAR